MENINIEHIVLFKFSANTTEAQLEELMQRAKKLKEDIPGILTLQIGKNFSERSQGFNVGMTMRFENEEALKVYRPHPKHQEFIAYLKEIGIEETLVVDFEV